MSTLVSEMWTAFINLDLDALIANTSITTLSWQDSPSDSVESVDGEAKVPGSIYKLYVEHRVWEFFSARQGQAITINAQFDCIVVVEIYGWYHLPSRTAMWAWIEQDCQKAAEASGCQLTFNLVQNEQS